MPKTPVELPILSFEQPADWSAWLEQNHALCPGLWLKLIKKSTGLQTINYDQALEAALCYGWIDGQKKASDETAWLQKFTPRGPKSIWSKINCAKVEALIANGRMQPAGLRAVESARQDGRWQAAYDSQSKAGVPEDLQAALDANPSAREFFATLNSANRYAITFRLQTAKKPETRAKRLAQFVEMLARQEKFHN